MDRFLAYFLPHPHTHKKAHLLSWNFFLVYILFFLLLKFGIQTATIYRPGVLGVNSEITTSQIIDLTNRERTKSGLPLLSENSQLDEAARLKAENMFTEGYWAHYSPSGKDPWNFITRAGYKFVYAGENLARNFSNSSDVVQAWMNSPSHRSNLLGSNYKEIGVAVADGVLKGQKTTLVVQMFGTPTGAAIPPQVNTAGKNKTAELQPANQSQPSVAGSEAKISNLQPLPKSVINPYDATKLVGILLMSFISILLLVDFIVLRRRGVFRPSSHHFAHFSFLAVTAAAIIASKAGEIL